MRCGYRVTRCPPMSSLCGGGGGGGGAGSKVAPKPSRGQRTRRLPTFAGRECQRIFLVFFFSFWADSGRVAPSPWSGCALRYSCVRDQPAGCWGPPAAPACIHAHRPQAAPPSGQGGEGRGGEGENSKCGHLVRPGPARPGPAPSGSFYVVWKYRFQFQE